MQHIRLILKSLINRYFKVTCWTRVQGDDSVTKKDNKIHNYYYVFCIIGGGATRITIWDTIQSRIHDSCGTLRKKVNLHRIAFSFYSLQLEAGYGSGRLILPGVQFCLRSAVMNLVATPEHSKILQLLRK